MKKILLLTSSLLLSALLVAQNEGNIWTFGFNYQLDFNSNPPLLSQSSAISAPEGSASVCDANGDLLFYSDGGGRIAPFGPIRGSIWNRNNDLMYDMQGMEGGGFSAAQSSIILPYPGLPNQYFLFTMEEIEFDTDGTPNGQEQGRGFSYFIVDMNENGGLGGVITADVNVHVPSYESLSAVRHNNGTDYWITIIDDNTEDFFVYRLDSDGLSFPTLEPRVFSPDGTQPIKFTPDGSKMTENGVLYNFDANSGNISAARVLNVSNAYGVTFSHNSQYLYIADQQGATIQLKRYDVTAGNIPDTEEVIFTLEDHVSGQMQLAPDGKIYWHIRPLSNLFNSYIYTIECPNSPDPSVVAEVFTLENPPAIQAAGLPNFADHIFLDNTSFELELGEDKILDCTTGPIILDAGNEGADFLWSTGANSQTIEVLTEGFYSVSVTLNCGTLVDSIRITEENPIPAIGIDGSTTACPGDTSILTGFSNEEVSFLWSTGDTSASILITENGTYALSITDLCGAVNSDSLTVLFLDRATLSFTGPDLVCEGEAVQLSVSSPGAEGFLWSNGSTEDTLVIDSAGTYFVSVTNACETLDSSFTIKESPLPEASIMASPVLCPGENKVLKAEFENIDRYVWSNGQSIPSITANQWTTYTLEAENECGIVRDSILLQPTGCENCIYIPNAFSPNDDGINDRFITFPVCPLESFHLHIYSRWGGLVFESKDATLGWDGFFRGERLNPGHFSWILEYEQADEKFVREGGVVLIR